MSRVDKLYNLIKLLTPNEKRFIRKFGQSDDTIYIQLFDYYDQQDEHDENHLKKAFEEILVNQKKKAQLSYTKNYLYEYILKTLRNYSTERSPTSQVNHLIEDIQFLLRRGHTDYLKNRIQQAKSFAKEHELFKSLLIILQLQRDYFKLIGETSPDLELIKKEERSYLKIISQENEYRSIADDIYLKTRKEWLLRDDNMNEDIKMVLAHPLMKNEESPLSFRNKILRLQTLSHIYGLKQESKKAFKLQQEILNMYEEKDQKIKLNSDNYLKLLNNYLVRCLTVRHYEDFEYYFKEYEDYKTYPFEKQANIFRCVIYFKLPYYLNKYDFEKATESIDDVISGLTTYNKFLPESRRLTLYANLLSYYFLNSNFREALKWVETIRGFEKNDIRLDIQNYARLIQVIIYFEIEDFHSLLPSLKKSFKRKYKKEDRLFKFEEFFLKSMEALSKTGVYDSKRDEILEKLRERINHFKEEKDGKIAGIEEISLWIESKCINQPIMEIIK